MPIYDASIYLILKCSFFDVAIYLHRSENITIYPDSQSKTKYLDVDELGSVLKALSEPFVHHGMLIYLSLL